MSCSKSSCKFCSFKRFALSSTLLALVSAVGGCSSINRLSQIGETPKLNAIENPTTQPGYKPVSMPMPKPETVSYNPNSLWRNGSRAFFKDQRAHQIGDILTVTVNIPDQANIANETQRSRASKEESGITAFLGDKLIKNPATAILPGRLLHYVWHEPLQFRPGSRYKYDNSDNVATAMMAGPRPTAATGRCCESSSTGRPGSATPASRLASDCHAFTCTGTRWSAASRPRTSARRSPPPSPGQPAAWCPPRPT